VRRLIGVFLLLILLFAISKSPGPWADTFDALGDNLAESFRGFGVFLTKLAT